MQLSRHTGIFFGKDLDDLLTSLNGKYCQEVPPSGCILLDENWRSWKEGENKQAINTYLRLTEFISFLKREVASHIDTEKIILFGLEDKLEIPLKFSAKRIEQDSGEVLDALATIDGLTDGNHHKKEKAHQLKAILLDELKSLPYESRMNALITNLPNISRRFAHNHELFVSGFSFDDSREILRRENRHYTSELNNVINSIHTRILGIPIGTVLPAFLIKTSSVETFKFDFLIFLSALFVCLVIAFSLYGQRRLLLKVRKEYSEKWKRMKTEIPNLEGELTEEFRDLESSFKINRFLIYLLFFILVLFFLVPLDAYFEIDSLQSVAKALSWILDLIYKSFTSN